MKGKLTVEIDGKEEVREIELTAEQEKLFEKPKEIFFFTDFGEIDFFDEGDYPKERTDHLFRHCFAAYSEAECLERKKTADLKAEYKEWCESKSEKMEWKNYEQGKYTACYNCRIKGIEVMPLYERKFADIAFASDKKIITDFITKIGEPAFKKYILEVQE